MKSKVFSRIFSFILAMIFCLSIATSIVSASAEDDELVAEEYSIKTNGANQNQINIAARGDYMYSLIWTAQKTVDIHSYSWYDTFYQGSQYHLPYGQGSVSNYIGYGVSPEKFMEDAANASSAFYAYKCWAGSWYSTYYIQDCSGFVSWCWGLTAKQSTRSLANYSNYVASITTNNIINYIQLGDALNRYDYHVVLVTDLIYTNGTLTGIEITEQTFPDTYRAIYTPSQLASTYASYDGIYRYTGTVPAPPYYVSEETWQEKAAFDTMVYRDSNPDIAHLSDDELKEHWLEYGIKEGRRSSPVLDLGFYLNNNPDLKDAFGTDYEKIYEHFIKHGYKEKRKSSSLFDGQYYTDHYPESVEKYGDDYMRHYVEHGILAGHRASLTFDPDYYWVIKPEVWEAWPAHYELCAKHYAGYGVNEGVEAYDNKAPVISDIVFSNISSKGYTVTCKVTDNWGIEYVSFPTWTTKNDQDDLAADFLNTQRGTANGDIYTFEVKTSDHNNEVGTYATHIYAQDLGGNLVSFANETIEVGDFSLEKITLISGSIYDIDGTLLKGVKVGSSVNSIISQFQNTSLKVTDASGNATNGNSVVGTGAKINLYNGNELIDSITIIILGDVDGNANIDATDYLRVKSAFLSGGSLNTAQKTAADVDENDLIDATDYIRIKSQFLGA